jgi:AbrB family looped-hinge helix DNA binding protein
MCDNAQPDLTDGEDLAMALPGRPTTTVSTKGQVILPKPVRDQYGWNFGTRLIVECVGEGVLLKNASVFAPTQAEQVFGSLRGNGEARTVAEMKFATEIEMKPRHARNR